MRPRRRRLWKILLRISLVFLVILVYAAWPGSSTFTVSPETTYVTGPVDKHGYIDYVTALNERLRGDIKPENNANVLIWQALGPHPEGVTMPEEYFQWLGIDPPPEQGEYMLSWTNYVKDHAKIENIDQRDEMIARTDKASRWPWTAKEQPEIAEWLKRNEKPLGIVIEATRRPDYYQPLVPKRTGDWSPGLLAALLPSVQCCRDVASALTCRAMLRIRDGKIDDAWQDLLACHRLGRLVARGGSLIELLVGIAIDLIATKADVAFLGNAKVTSQQLLRYLQDHQRLPPIGTVAEKLDRWERFICLDSFLMLARDFFASVEVLQKSSRGLTDIARPGNHRLWGRLFTHSVDWDAALRNANRTYERCAAGSRLTDRPARRAAMDEIVRDMNLRRQEASELGFIENLFVAPTRRGELIGDILIALLLPAFDKVQSAADRFEQTHRNLHVAFALAAYQRDHGRYPAKLDELAPKYLAKIPDDLFSGQPLIYKPADTGYLLYSVGPNGKDDGGVGYDDEPRGDDLVVRMPVPEPRGKN